jgi:hypothetical protein
MAGAGRSRGQIPRLARGSVPSARQEKVIGKVRELEKLASVAELMNDLAEGKTA